ncbi:MAG: Dam family site-specific DNA-(adenine-N6)-methyltransferase [Thermoplasmata archaeon]|nr:Dam family site-specific DNA-(adenine-N6)-methyltransferase [Thermoplasmata archaeon]
MDRQARRWAQLPLRPPLKWAGGKRWLIPHLEPLWSGLNRPRLVEPFVGGLSVALALRPRQALLNDINPHPVNLYRWIQTGLTLSIPLNNNRETFDRNRNQFNSLVRGGQGESREAAELFYYLNRTCYNGLCRFNSSGGFNTPFGRYKRINYITDFQDYRPVLTPWKFQSGDFERLKVRRGDFVYADPPYDVEFTHYSKEGFSWEDQIRLADWLAGLESPVVASNQGTERVLNLYLERGFKVTTLKAPRMINCTGDRTKATEMLAVRGV